MSFLLRVDKFAQASWSPKSVNIVAQKFPVSVAILQTVLMQLSMANLNSPSSRVVKDSTPFRRRILRCKHFGNGESSPSLFWDVVNLYIIEFKEG